MAITIYKFTKDVIDYWTLGGSLNIWTSIGASNRTGRNIRHAQTQYSNFILPRSHTILCIGEHNGESYGWREITHPPTYFGVPTSTTITKFRCIYATRFEFNQAHRKGINHYATFRYGGLYSGPFEIRNTSETLLYTISNPVICPERNSSNYFRKYPTESAWPTLDGDDNPHPDRFRNIAGLQWFPKNWIIVDSKDITVNLNSNTSYKFRINMNLPEVSGGGNAIIKIKHNAFIFIFTHN